MNLTYINQEFYSWTVRSVQNGGFICECKCGQNQWIAFNKLLKGKSKMCRLCSNRLKSRLNLKHGCGIRKNRPRIYTIYYLMLRRCADSSDPNFCHYGGKGISVCDRWKKSFAHFLEDMGHPPEDFFLDRIDNSKDYFPENCRWVSKGDSARNTSRNVFYIFEGKKICQSELLRELGIKSLCTLRYWINKIGIESTIKKFMEKKA